MTMTTVETFKRRKVDELEKNKARLLSVLWTINYGDGFLCEVSEEVKKLQGYKFNGYFKYHSELELNCVPLSLDS